ncbi:MAG: ATP-binding cassette domain-containing protein, partial [Marinobacter sp.]|nr:ATP-binding cassette domain-containing protein [Marinobacter sp.]
MSKLLDISDLTIAFDDGPNVVENVSLSLDKGEIVALVGESGSGKSVTALSILRLLDERHVRYPSGRILFHDQNLLDIDPQPLRRIRGRQISMIFQEPMTSLNPLHTVEKQITETLALHRGLRNQQARDRCVELLELVGITNAAERLGSYPHQLSGGQKQRVMIAMALANEPDLLIADEPTTALDVTVQKQVLELLQSLQHRLGMGILLITHDLSIVRRYADRVVVMEHGRVVEQARTATLFSAPRHPYTRSLLDAEPPASPPPVEPGSEPLLAVTDLNVRFTTRKSLLGKTLAAFHAVQNVSFELTRGETLGIVGESGSGKTTIGHALLKLTQSDGDIRFGQDQLSGLNQRQFRPYRRRMQIVFQDPFGSLSPRMSIAEIVREGLLIHDADAP